MHQERIVAGLDIGTTHTKVAVGRMNDQGILEIIGTGIAESHGVMRGMVANIDKATESIQAAMKEAELSSGIDINVVKLGLSDQSIAQELHSSGSITRQTMDSEITQEDVSSLKSDMYKTVVAPGNDIVNVMPQTYAVDYRNSIKDPIGITGVKLEGIFRIITAPSNSIRNAQKCLTKLGLQVEDVTIAPLAASLVALSREEKDAGVCLVDLGGGNTKVSIFNESILQHIAVLPLGSDLITSDIKQACTVMPHQAELLKVKFGLANADFAEENDSIEISGIRNRNSKSIPLKTLSVIIEARVSEIASTVNEQITKTNFRNKLPAGVVLVGGGANLKFVANIFENITGIETRIAHATEGIDASSLSKLDDPAMTDVVGLVMNGFKHLDYREEYYRLKNKEAVRENFSGDRSSTDGFLKKIWSKTRTMIMNDYAE